jgi:hypothetical protein
MLCFILTTDENLVLTGLGSHRHVKADSMRANSTVDRSLLHINQLPRRREVIAHTLSRLLSLPEDGLTWARFMEPSVASGSAVSTSWTVDEIYEQS